EVVVPRPPPTWAFSSGLSTFALKYLARGLKALPGINFLETPSFKKPFRGCVLYKYTSPRETVLKLVFGVLR
ncbi:hypothetical protein ACVGXS_00865, partial [Enterobacter hormaechei]